MHAQRLAHHIRCFSTSTSAPIGHLGKFLSGKSALVTGSTSGIGLGIAKILAAHGCNLTLNGFGDQAEIKKIVKEITETHGVKVAFDGADMSDPAQIRAMVEKAQKSIGLDILVNNAGIQYVSPVKDFPDEMWNKIVAINLSAVFHATKAVLPSMLEKGYGRIINVSSVHGLVASVNKAPYVSSKHGVMGLTKATALETAGTGVTCNAINPGFVLTPLIEKQIQLKAEAKNLSFEEAKVDLLADKQPSKQFVTVDDLGNLAVFLCSPYANQITGQPMAMDGGWTAQ